MRRLSFTTFLRRTLRELSIDGQTAPYQLAKETERNPRLVQPLCLYLALVYDETQQEKLLCRFPKLKKEFHRWNFLTLSGVELEQALERLQDPEDGYGKLWRSYVSVRDRKYTDNQTKELIHRKVRALQAEKKVSNYRIYTDLHLNPGNLNAWLLHADCSKVSLNTARRILQYLKQYAD